MTRKVTNKLLEMLEEGILPYDVLVMACLNYMSEADVADMAHINGFLLEGEEDDS